MRVERAGVDKVMQHMEEIKSDMLQSSLTVKPSSMESHESRVAKSIAEDEEAKRKRKLEKKKKEEVINEDELDTIDPEMAALMGFGGFGGGAKKK